MIKSSMDFQNPVKKFACNFRLRENKPPLNIKHFILFFSTKVLFVIYRIIEYRRKYYYLLAAF